MIGTCMHIDNTGKRTRSYISLGSRFYELSENPSLTKTKDISDELDESVCGPQTQTQNETIKEITKKRLGKEEGRLGALLDQDTCIFWDKT